MYAEIVRCSILGASSYAIYLSGTAAQQLQSYLSISQKAAKVSSTAEDELNMTSKTVGVAVLSSIFSLASLVYVHFKADAWTNYISLFNTCLTCFAYKSVQRYWKSGDGGGASGASKNLPGAGDYMDAWGKMQQLQPVLLALAGLWTGSTMLASPNKFLNS